MIFQTRSILHRLDNYRSLESRSTRRKFPQEDLGMILGDIPFEAQTMDEEDHSAKSSPLGSQQARNFMTWPVTAREDRILLSKATTNITAAICHPTLFGNISLHRTFSFVSYYRLLGFEHFFFWYEPETLAWSASEIRRFENLPYVTLTKYDATNYDDIPYHGQAIVQKQCLGDPKYAALFDWVLAADVDEFLWLGPNVGTVQDFVRQQPNITYYSFGKWQYATKVSSPPRKSGNFAFGLESFPFTPGRYCYKDPEAESCPTWTGRSKILLKPSLYPSSKSIHGEWGPLYKRSGEAVHYNHQLAHLKEWPGIGLLGDSEMTETIEPQSFLVDIKKPIGVHHQAFSFPRLPNQTLFVKYDEGVIPWLQGVASNLNLE